MTKTWYSKTEADLLLAGKETAGAAAAAQAAAIAAAAAASKSADTITDGTTNKAYTATERTKLAGIATAATANRADAATDALLAAKADLVGGIIPTAQIPALALTAAIPVANQAAMLALTTSQVQPGDIAVRADGAGTFILTATDPTQLANWLRLNAPTDVVTSVNGQQGTVVLNAANVGADPAGAAAAVTPASLGLGNVNNTSDSAKPVSTAQQAALDAKAPLTSPAFTGSPTVNGSPIGTGGATGTTIIPSGSTVAATNTLLAAGGRFRGLPGTIYDFSAGSLIVPSNTELDMTGCTITAATADAYVKNAAAVPARTVTDAVTTAGSAVVTSATANFTSADVGKAVQILAAGPNVGNAAAPGSLYGTVLSADSTTQITLSQAATSTTSGKTLNVFPARDSNITIVGGTWNGGARTAQTLTGHGFLLRRLDNVRVRNATLTSTGSSSGGSRYAIAYGDVTNAEFSGITFNTVSDGLHGQGPLQNIAIHHIYGTTGDDMVAFTGVDGQSTTGSLLGDVEGDITDVTVTDVFPVASLRAIKLTSGTGTNGVARIIKGFHAARIAGTAQLDTISVVDYAGVTTFDGTISDVTTRPSGSGFYPRVTLGGSGSGTVLLRNIRWDDTGHCPTGGIISITAAIQSVTVDGLTMKGTVAGNGVGVLVSGIVGSLALNGLRVPDATPTFYGIQYGTTATQAQGRIAVRDVYKLGGGDLINVTSAVTAFSYTDLEVAGGYQLAGRILGQSADGTTTLKMRFSNWRQPGGYLASLQSPAEVSLSNVQWEGTGGAIRAASAAATSLRLRVNASPTPNGTLFSRTASQAVSMNGSDATADITTLTPLDGDVVYNTNASASTGVGRSIYNATTPGWINLETAATGGGGGTTIPSGLYDATLDGFKSWAFDPVAAIASSASASNVGTYARQVSAGGTITNVHVGVAAIPTGVTDARGIVYDSTGAILGVTANMSSDLAAAGFKTWALQAPITGVAAGTIIYVAFWATGGAVTLLKTNSNAPVPGVMYVGTPRQLQQSNTAYQTSITPGSMGASSTLFWNATS